MSRPKVQEKVVAQLNLEGCPEGEVLNNPNPNPHVDRFFEGWENPLTPHKYWNRPSNLFVVYENGRPVLEYNDLGERIVGRGVRCLITGDNFWQDYMIESEIRIMGNIARANADNSVHVFPWAGIVFRLQDVRHYYFFCLRNTPNDQKIVLYRRADNDWHILAERQFPIDTNKYYALKVKVSGNRIHCYMDGEEVFCITDYLYKRGKVGVRFNTRTRVKSIKVTMSPGEELIFLSAKKKYCEELEAIRRKYPKPVLLKKIDLSRFWPFSISFLNLRSSKFKDMLLFCPEKIVAVDLDGKIIWKREGSFSADLSYRSPRGSRNRLNVIPSSKGGVEIPAISEKENKIVIIGSSSGKILKETPLPPLKPRPRRWNIKVANLRGKNEPRDILLKIDNADGGNMLWAYDDDLNLMWETMVLPKYGHYRSIAFYDINNDGREEILAGGSLLSSDGEVIWRVERHQEITWTPRAGHVDAVIIGNFAKDEYVDPLAFLATGSAGLWVVDALTGKVRDIHYVGHAQGLSFGDFRHDVPGLEVLCGCRWDNYGILNLFSGRGERLLTFQPDSVCEGGIPVNWAGDGEELILIATSSKSIGLWDGYGRKVVTFPIEDLPEKRTDYYRGGEYGCLNIHGDERDEIFFCSGGKIHFFTQSK